MNELQYNRIWKQVFNQTGKPPEEFPKAVDAILADMESGKILVGETAAANSSIYLTRFRTYFSNCNTLESTSRILGVSRKTIYGSVQRVEIRLRRYMEEYL